MERSISLDHHSPEPKLRYNPKGSILRRIMSENLLTVNKNDTFFINEVKRASAHCTDPESLYKTAACQFNPNSLLQQLQKQQHQRKDNRVVDVTPAQSAGAAAEKSINGSFFDFVQSADSSFNYSFKSFSSSAVNNCSSSSFLTKSFMFNDHFESALCTDKSEVEEDIKTKSTTADVTSKKENELNSSEVISCSGESQFVKDVRSNYRSNEGKNAKNVDACPEATASRIEPVEDKLVAKNGNKIALAVKFECDICGVSFNYKKNLKRHIVRLHLRLKSLDCPKCGSNFSFEKNLKRHVVLCSSSSSSSDGRKETKTSKCDECEREFYFESDLKNHRLFLHCSSRAAEMQTRDNNARRRGDKRKNDERLWKKFKPSFKYSTSNDKINKVIKPFKCGICQRQFGSLNSYKVHVNNSHLLDSASFDCDDCGEQYSFKHALEKHIDVYH